MIFELKKLFGILKEPLFLRALWKGTAAGVEHKAVLANLKGCRHIIDVGANRGQFALVSRGTHPDIRIDSFEPLQEPAAIYRRIFRGDDLIRLYSCAVGACEGEAIIHVSGRDDSSSLLPISESQTALYPETAEKETRSVRVLPLDAVLSEHDIVSPALLKIDVQGYELEALRGCESLLPCFEWIYCECSFVPLYDGQALAHEVIAWLSARGFELCGAYNMSYDGKGRAVQADFLFNRAVREGVT